MEEKNIQVIVPLKYLSNFQRTSEMPLINFEADTFLIWSKNLL